MDNFNKHIISHTASVKDALNKLNELGADAVVFLVKEDMSLVGSLTDGDLRRGFLRDLNFNNQLEEFVQRDPIFIFEDSYTIEELEEYREKNYKIIPIVDRNKKIKEILNFRTQKTILPVHGVLMAGGKGKRLLPLTLNTPKPLLQVGNKPIIEYNVTRMVEFGIKNIEISINYLGQQIKDYFEDGAKFGANIKYLTENEPLGTLGSIHLVDEFIFEDILIMNSDLLTNIDFSDFYRTFKKSGADMAVAATSYHVDVPYAVLEVDKHNMATSLKEKPRYTYYSNAGIYLVKKELLVNVPKGVHFDITELMESVITTKKRLITYPITGYWLDIGKHDDFNKAQEDVKHIRF